MTEQQQQPEYNLQPTQEKTQTITSLQEDIKTGNIYRLESLKLMMTLATGLLAFTVTFRPTLGAVAHNWLIYLSWCSLGVSVVSGIGVMLCWERFYLSYRLDWHGQGEKGIGRRKRVTGWRRFLFFLQFALFAVGVIGVAFFAAENFNNIVRPPH